VSVEGHTVEEALGRRCIADTSLLNNFVHSGNALLLNRLLRGPVFLSPAVLDRGETLLADFAGTKPSSEFLQPLYRATTLGQSGYRDIAAQVQSFAVRSGDLWEQAEPAQEEVALALHFRSRQIREEVRQRCPDIKRSRIRLGDGEAEAAAIAITRGWTFLTDDQASVDLLRCLYPEVPPARTCTLLRYAAELEHIPCEEAAWAFNHRIVDGLGFWARRGPRTGRERLWLRCDPPRCEWEPEMP
jgi:hypothetical protein